MEIDGTPWNTVEGLVERGEWVNAFIAVGRQDKGEFLYRYSVQERLSGELLRRFLEEAWHAAELSMTDDVVAALKAHKTQPAGLRLQAGPAYVFTTRTGQPHGARNVIRAFKRALKRAGLREMWFPRPSP